jgi:hypothetical protein
MAKSQLDGSFRDAPFVQLRGVANQRGGALLRAALAHGHDIC